MMGILSRLFKSAPEPATTPALRPAPTTTEERAQRHHEDIQAMLRDQAASSPRQAREIEAGTVDGVHYLELVEPIKQAKREGRNEDALALCYQAIQGAEQGRGGSEPAPAYTRHAAIILRKLGRPDEEAAVLERYLQFVPAERRQAHEFTERLRKARVLGGAGE
ncbi:hypothetical protein [Brachybacterium sp. NPDC056505]|uniref:hypothetical protein n=1 Tax=Brachybacterium sp. NPDC056505 TaxID=3345843 RepID=UPI00366DC470